MTNTYEAKSFTRDNYNYEHDPYKDIDTTTRLVEYNRANKQLIDQRNSIKDQLQRGYDILAPDTKELKELKGINSKLETLPEIRSAVMATRNMVNVGNINNAHLMNVLLNNLNIIYNRQQQLIVQDHQRAQAITHIIQQLYNVRNDQDLNRREFLQALHQLGVDVQGDIRFTRTEMQELGGLLQQEVRDIRQRLQTMIDNNNQLQRAIQARYIAAGGPPPPQSDLSGAVPDANIYDPNQTWVQDDNPYETEFIGGESIQSNEERQRMMGWIKNAQQQQSELLDDEQSLARVDPVIDQVITEFGNNNEFLERFERMVNRLSNNPLNELQPASTQIWDNMTRTSYQEGSGIASQQRQLLDESIRAWYSGNHSRILAKQILSLLKSLALTNDITPSESRAIRNIVL